MAKISSAIGSKTYQQPMREFVVDDYSEQDHQHYSHSASATQHMPQSSEIDYREHLRTRNAQNLQQDKISEGAKKRIEILCGMTQLSREIQIGETKFVVQSLKNKHNRQALAEAMKFDGTIEFPFEIRRQILSRAITFVSDIEVDMFLGDDSLQAKLNFLDELDEVVVERIYQEYLLLNKEIKEKFSIKTTEDLEQVSEELKK